MDGTPPNEATPIPPNDRAGLRRAAAAVAISLLIHIAIALMMRNDTRPVNDFAVDLEITTMSPAPPKPPEKAPPETTPLPKEEPVKPAPKKPSHPKVASKEAPIAAAEKETESKETEPAPVPEQETDTSEGGGICMHNLFAFENTEPDWLLYVAAAAFRGSAYEKELDNTFNSFELGRRLADMTGMDLTRDVESLLVSASDIFDWRTFQIILSYDFGEEALMARIKEKQKSAASFAWNKTDEGFEAAIQGQFLWELVGSGRVMSIAHEPEHKIVGIPDNPFADLDTAKTEGPSKNTESALKAASTDDAATAEDKAEPPNDEASKKEKASNRPKQIECIVLPKKKEESKKSSVSVETLIDIAKSLMEPDAEGHWPVAVLTTRDPRAVGLGARLGKRMGFEVASVRGYFTDPVRLEGFLRFSKDPEKVAELAAEWRREAERFAQDPLMAVAGVSSLLKNLTLTTEGSTLRFSLELKESQVLSTLLFLQLQGKALERQLLSD